MSVKITERPHSPNVTRIHPKAEPRGEVPLASGEPAIDPRTAAAGLKRLTEDLKAHGCSPERVYPPDAYCAVMKYLLSERDVWESPDKLLPWHIQEAGDLLVGAFRDSLEPTAKPGSQDPKKV